MSVSKHSTIGRLNNSTSQRYDVECRVKCPRCKKHWIFRSNRLLVAPKYKYCGKCDGIVSNLGDCDRKGVMRGKDRPPAGGPRHTKE